MFWPICNLIKIEDCLFWNNQLSLCKYKLVLSHSYHHQNKTKQKKRKYRYRDGKERKKQANKKRKKETKIKHWFKHTHKINKDKKKLIKKNKLEEEAREKCKTLHYQD